MSEGEKRELLFMFAIFWNSLNDDIIYDDRIEEFLKENKNNE